MNILNVDNISEKDRYYESVQLIFCMIIFINRLAKTFDFIASNIETENKKIKEHLREVYYEEVYVHSEEYIRQCEEEAEGAEYLELHPELLYHEESEEEKFLSKIDEAIWLGDVETIKECFPQIDKDNEVIQSYLTWNIAKDVMKNKELRKLYYEKYGVKYKVRKEK